jgi:ATP-dependent DNA helicase
MVARKRREPAATAGLAPDGELERAGIPSPVASILRAQGITSLYPPQREALAPLYAGKSLLLACPTASGKSLVAYLALLRAAAGGRTGLYLVPLRALAQEKRDELAAFESLGYRVGLSMGDFDLSNEKLDRLDILVATSEKADGLLRRGAPWIDRLGVVVADEVHLLRDPERGPTLEVSLTRLRRRHPELQVVALSATIQNSEQLAEWLGAAHLASDFRPVPLKRGVYRDGRITFTDLSTRDLPGRSEPLPRLVTSVLQEGGQALIFVNTRRGSEQTALALAEDVGPLLTSAEREGARQAEQQLLATAEEETEGIRRLSTMLPHGVAFHNASLTNPERRVVEQAFKERRLKLLVATPTLAAGINLPARRVIVRDTTRYDDGLGMQTPIPVLEVQQMLGRAGRPRFDREGEAVLVARREDDEQFLLEHYLTASPERVESRLAAEPALRMHLLALVASEEVRTPEELEHFLAATLYGRTLPMEQLSSKVRDVLEFLEQHDFLLVGSRLRASAFGRLTSDLYLDPLSALVLRRALERASRGVRPFALLAAIAATPDLPPLFLRRGEEATLTERFVDEESELLFRPEEEPLDLAFDWFLACLKTAAILETWTEEVPIVDLTQKYNIGAGDLRQKVEDAEWLLFALSRIASRFRPELVRALDALSLRIRYGVREELLDLVRLRGIGRVRGRALFRQGFEDRDSLRSASPAALLRALRSPALVESVLKQVRFPAAPPGKEPTVGRGPPPAPASPPEESRSRVRRLDEFPEPP